jgi:hypothetical protein
MYDNIDKYTQKQSCNRCDLYLCLYLFVCHSLVVLIAKLQNLTVVRRYEDVKL